MLLEAIYVAYGYYHILKPNISCNFSRNIFLISISKKFNREENSKHEN